jgi:hypothetical protein
VYGSTRISETAAAVRNMKTLLQARRDFCGDRKPAARQRRDNDLVTADFQQGQESLRPASAQSLNGMTATRDYRDAAERSCLLESATEQWRSNHRAAWPITASSAPGSGNRCVAPGTISIAFSPLSRANASSFSSMTP